jgi:hypothetical protein
MGHEAAGFPLACLYQGNGRLVFLGVELAMAAVCLVLWAYRRWPVSTVPNVFLLLFHYALVHIRRRVSPPGKLVTGVARMVPPLDLGHLQVLVGGLSPTRFHFHSAVGRLLPAVRTGAVSSGIYRVIGRWFLLFWRDEASLLPATHHVHGGERLGGHHA